MQFGERNLLHYSVRWDSGYLYGIRSPHIGEGWLIITNFHGTIVMEVWLSWSHLLHVGSPDQKELTKGVKHSLHLCHFSNRSDEHKAERSTENRKRRENTDDTRRTGTVPGSLFTKNRIGKGKSEKTLACLSLHHLLFEGGITEHFCSANILLFTEIKLNCAVVLKTIFLEYPNSARQNIHCI